jgi:hypothetical protein
MGSGGIEVVAEVAMLRCGGGRKDFHFLSKAEFFSNLARPRLLHFSRASVRHCLPISAVFEKSAALGVFGRRDENDAKAKKRRNTEEFNALKSAEVEATVRDSF